MKSFQKSYKKVCAEKFVNLSDGDLFTIARYDRKSAEKIARFLKRKLDFSLYEYSDLSDEEKELVVWDFQFKQPEYREMDVHLAKKAKKYYEKNKKRYQEYYIKLKQQRKEMNA